MPGEFSSLRLNFPGCSDGVDILLCLPVLRFRRCLQWLALQHFAAGLTPCCTCVVWCFPGTCIVGRWCCVFPFCLWSLRCLSGTASFPSWLFAVLRHLFSPPAVRWVGVFLRLLLGFFHTLPAEPVV